MNGYNNYPYQYVEMFEQPRQLVIPNTSQPNMINQQSIMPVNENLITNSTPPVFEPQHIPTPIVGQYGFLKGPTLETVGPLVQYGLHEARRTCVETAMTKVASITYLMGKGYPAHISHQIVHHW